MNVLVANDDGIRAEGIYRLVETLSKEADVYVSAPHIQRSASGHSISVGAPLEISEVDFDNAKLALEITGTPADCVKLGVKELERRGIGIDMVFSGINHGGNLGTDTLYSGTVSAAIEGCICKKPSVAVSVNSHFPKHFELACELALSALQKAYGRLDCHSLISINVPNLAKAEVKGIKYARLGDREYKEWFEPKVNADGALQYWYSGEPVLYEGQDTGIDVIAMQEGYAVITPLHYDLTDYKLLEEIEDWRIGG
ncbi:MAG: 5'/3'-nucleotidase SurE [Clostridiales bacterium]|nr:5'/3'-nucleotidase SurE [Clostridiales bacterium]